MNKKFLCLSLAALGTLTACGGVSAQDFVNKVAEKRKNLVRTEYNVVVLEGTCKQGTTEIKSSENSVLKVTWTNGTPNLMPKVLTDPFVLACMEILPVVDLTNELAQMFATPEEGDVKTTYTLFGVSAEGKVDGQNVKQEYKWNDELLITSSYTSGKIQGVDVLSDVKATWKVEN